MTPNTQGAPNCDTCGKSMLPLLLPRQEMKIDPNDHDRVREYVLEQLPHYSLRLE